MTPKTILEKDAVEPNEEIEQEESELEDFADETPEQGSENGEMEELPEGKYRS
jgi:hypothetical protein